MPGKGPLIASILRKLLDTISSTFQLINPLPSVLLQTNGQSTNCLLNPPFFGLYVLKLTSPDPLVSKSDDVTQFLPV